MMGSSRKYSSEILKDCDAIEEWDRFVDESPQGNIFSHSWWLEAVCPGKFQILILRKGDRIVAGMAMVESERLGLKTICMPRLTPTLGVLLKPSKSQKYETKLSDEMKLLREFVRAIPAVDYFNMSFHHSFTNWLPFYWAGYKQTTLYTCMIEDVSDLDAVFNNMNKNTRTVIRKAEKCGIVVEEDGDVEMFLELNNKTFIHQGKKPPYTDEFIRDFDAACARQNARTIFIAKDGNNNAHSAVYVVHDNKCVHALMSGTDPQFRSSGANSLAYWKSIELAHKLNIRFDFTGSIMENVERILRGFGTRQTPYFRITKANLRGKIWWKLRTQGGRVLRALRFLKQKYIR